MFRDIIILGAVMGLLADAIKLTVNFIFYSLKITDVVFWQLTATRFLDREYLFQPLGYLVGGIADLTVTAILGVGFVILLLLSGKDYLWIKGLGFGLFVWVTLFGTLLGQSVQAKLPQDPSGILVTVVAHTFFGLSLAGAARFLYRPESLEPEMKNGLAARAVPVPARKMLLRVPKDEAGKHEKKKYKKPVKLEDLLD